MEQPNTANSQSPSHEPKTTEVLVLLKAKPGVTREQVMKIMPAEIRATVRLYLDGMIRQWFSRSDGKGVVLILDCKGVAEAHAMMDGLPLSAENLMDHEFIPIGPLMPKYETAFKSVEICVGRSPTSRGSSDR